MNYWQFKLPINIWVKEGSEFDSLKENDIYSQTVQDKSNEPRDNIGDIVFIHNTVEGSNKKYPNGIYFICEIISKLDYDSINLKVIKSFKNNPIQLENVGFKELKVFVNKKGMNGRVYKFTEKDNGKKLYESLLLQQDIVDVLLKDVKDIEKSSIKETEKENLIKSRLGQGSFRRDLVNYWNGCSVTGSKQIDILIASHIKPWKDANNDERLNSFNGLLLIPTIDKLFDKGYISFNDNGEIIISEKLNNYKVLGINKKMKIKISSRHKKYLKYHRKNVLKSLN